MADLECIGVYQLRLTTHELDALNRLLDDQLLHKCRRAVIEEVDLSVGDYALIQGIGNTIREFYREYI